jgi:hypothetical protein
LICYLPHNEIDKSKWDECISGSSPNLPYAFSWYLDIVSPGWDGLISDSYEAVMPLPFKQKWFVTYVYKPFFVQQLGVFSGDSVTPAFLDSFIQKIPGRFRYIYTTLNESNTINNSPMQIKNVNHMIRIDKDYQDIYKDYSRNCRRNIKKAFCGGLSVDTDMDIHQFVKFVFVHLEQQLSRFDKEQSNMLERIVVAAQQKKIGQLVGIYTPQHELCAAGFFMQTKDRHVFSVCASSEKGKQYDAMYLLVDDQIKKTAGIKKWFDFSGSNIKGIAYFNQSFGARVVTYPILHLSRLPFPLRLLKD